MFYYHSFSIDRSVSRQSSVASISQPSDLYYYMQKTLPAGILLIELSFRDIFFSVSVYSFESARLSNGKRINQQVRLLSVYTI